MVTAGDILHVMSFILEPSLGDREVGRGQEGLGLVKGKAKIPYDSDVEGPERR